MSKKFEVIGNEMLIVSKKPWMIDEIINLVTERRVLKGAKTYYQKLQSII